MERIQIFELACFSQSLRLDGVSCSVGLTFCPISGAWLFDLADGSGADIVQGVKISPFAPLVSKSARARFPELQGNFFVFPEDNETAAADKISFEDLTTGKFGLFYVSAIEGGEA